MLSVNSRTKQALVSDCTKNFIKILSIFRANEHNLGENSSNQIVQALYVGLSTTSHAMQVYKPEDQWSCKSSPET